MGKAVIFGGSGAQLVPGGQLYDNSGTLYQRYLNPVYQTASATAAVNTNYLCNTTSAAITMTLPTGAANSIIRFTDDAGTWATNNLTIAPAATQTIQGISASGSLVCNLSGAWVELAWDATNSYWVVAASGFQYGPTATNTSAGIAVAQKQYVVGTAYTNGTPAVTCAQAGYTITRGVLIPYQTYDGAWRLKFNVAATFTSASLSAVTQTISGVTFKNVVSFYQTVSGMWLGTGSGGVFQTYVSPNTGQVLFNAVSATTEGGIVVSGDVELDSKPTWAD